MIWGRVRGGANLIDWSGGKLRLASVFSNVMYLVFAFSQSAKTKLHTSCRRSWHGFSRVAGYCHTRPTPEEVKLQTCVGPAAFQFPPFNSASAEPGLDRLRALMTSAEISGAHPAPEPTYRAG